MVSTACHPHTHDITVLAYEYSDTTTGNVAAFLQNKGDTTEVIYNGTNSVVITVNLVLFEWQELFNTERVAIAGIPCNRTFSPVVVNGSCQVWLEPLRRRTMQFTLLFRSSNYL